MKLKVNNNNVYVNMRKDFTMSFGDIIAHVQNDSIKSFVPLSDLQTKKDIKKYISEGYIVGYTYIEFKSAYPEIDADKIFFCKGFNPTYYFDRDNLILFFIPLYGTQAVTVNNAPLSNHVKECIDMFKEELNRGNYDVGCMALSGRMRMEYLNLCLDSGLTKGMYESFLNYYTLSDYGCDAISPENMEKLVSIKPASYKTKTTKALRHLPDVITVYRGEGELSTPTEKAWSWTLDINQANFFAARYGKTGGRIITATVPKSKIFEYISDIQEQECLVNPKDITLVDVIDLYGEELISNMSKRSISLFQKYRDLMLSHLNFYSDIHGASHTARVLFLSLLLADMNKLNIIDKEILATAAMYHDVGRVDDDIDDHHGSASAMYYKDYRLNFMPLNPYVEFLIKYLFMLN